MPDNPHLQRHIGSAIAYNVWQYFQITHDLEFLEFYGAELILEIACFWSSIATFNKERGRYEIRSVIGPDEFHDAYPEALTPGLDNNAYTNVMAVWVVRRSQDMLARLSEMRRSELTTRLGLTGGEIGRAGENYRDRYGNIQRPDLILEAEQDTANRYKLSKQAEVSMLFYLFSADELRALPNSACADTD